MATSVESTVVTLERTLAAVSDSTLCTPPTSLTSRDWISPVRVLREEAQRHALQVVVELVAQVAHDLLPDQP